MHIQLLKMIIVTDAIFYNRHYLHQMALGCYYHKELMSYFSAYRGMPPFTASFGFDQKYSLIDFYSLFFLRGMALTPLNINVFIGNGAGTVAGIISDMLTRPGFYILGNAGMP